jgi:hypothetical protein
MSSPLEEDMHVACAGQPRRPSLPRVSSMEHSLLPKILPYVCPFSIARNWHCSHASVH